jgi:uncharacterized damage-inducible protein DinB
MKSELTETLIKLFERDLNKLALELSQYRDERSIWLVGGEIKNTAGNLCLHLCGNLQHYIGVGLAKTDYKRDRDREFSDKNISRDELLSLVAKTKETVLNALRNFDASLLDTEYPLPVFDYAMTYTYFLVHLQGHLQYHLGQINYHRRLIG